MADIFMSYASADRARVWPLVDALAEHGWSVWWDRDIDLGSGFDEAIDREIAAAQCVVVAWSASSIASRWVRNEALEGLDRNALIPVMLEEVRVPIAFRHIQGANFAAGFDRGSAEFERLLTAVGDIVAPTNAPLPNLTPPTADNPTFAVLPLHMELSSAEDRFLVEDIAQGTTARLARLPGLFALSSSSLQKYVGQTVDPLRTGTQLGVRYVVDGTLRRRGELLSVTVRLSDTLNGIQLWSTELETSVANLANAQDTIVREIVRELVVRIEPELARAELADVGARKPHDLDAWQLYRQASARFSVKGWREEAIHETVAILDEAIAKDPDFALAYALQSVLLGVGNRLGLWQGDAAEIQSRALDTADRALQLDDADSNVLGFVGCTLADFGDHQRGRIVLDKAIDLDPSNAQAYVARAASYADTGELEQAEADCERGLQLSPRDARQAAWLLTYVGILLKSGRLPEAVAAARFACQRDTRHFATWVLLALAQLLSGDAGAAGASIAEAKRLRPSLSVTQLNALIGEFSTSVMQQAGLLDGLEEGAAPQQTG